MALVCHDHGPASMLPAASFKFGNALTGSMDPAPFTLEVTDVDL